MIGLAAVVRKKHDVAISEFKVVVEPAGNAGPATMVRLAGTYNLAGEPREAITVLDTVEIMADVHPLVRRVAQVERDRVVKMMQSAS